VPGQVRRLLEIGAGGRFAVINPGAGWPNKQWPAGRYGAIAAHLRARHGMPSIVTWGPREQALAGEVAASSDGAAKAAPSTSIATCRARQGCGIFVAGDTGPMQLAAGGRHAGGRDLRTDEPAAERVVESRRHVGSRFDDCECHHKRKCRRDTPCINTITIEQVATPWTAASGRRGRVADIWRRLARLRVPSGSWRAFWSSGWPGGLGCARHRDPGGGRWRERPRGAAGHLEKSREVTCSGPYRWSRHPLYVGSALMGVGLAIAGNSAVAAAVIGFYLMITMAAAIRTEEAFLRSRFGRSTTITATRHRPPLRPRIQPRPAWRNREYRAVLARPPSSRSSR